MFIHRRALLLSSSNCYGFSCLEFAKDDICSFIVNSHGPKEVTFIPYAQENFEEYTNKIKNILEPWGIKVTGLHTFSKPSDGINNSKAIFVGGGNTFLLLKRLYDYQLIDLIRKKVLQGDLSYIGSSAGTNVATKSIHTTNDMPIIYPPSFDGIGIVPFNINPHYTDFIENERHRGETRDQRIEEYLKMPYAAPVLSLREGSILNVNGEHLELRGVSGAVLFKKNENKVEYQVGADLSFLLKENENI